MCDGNGIELAITNVPYQYHIDHNDQGSLAMGEDCPVIQVINASWVARKSPRDDGFRCDRLILTHTSETPGQ